MRIKTPLGIIVAFAFLLQGCGHKGPLFHPAPASTPANSTPQK